MLMPPLELLGLYQCQLLDLWDIR